jgi:hypothetical protein
VASALDRGHSVARHVPRLASACQGKADRRCSTSRWMAHALMVRPIHGNELSDTPKWARSFENLQPLTTAEGTLHEPRRGGRQNWRFCAAPPRRVRHNQLQIFGRASPRRYLRFSRRGDAILVSDSADDHDCHACGFATPHNHGPWTTHYFQAESCVGNRPPRGTPEGRRWATNEPDGRGLFEAAAAAFPRSCPHRMEHEFDDQKAGANVHSHGATPGDSRQRPARLNGTHNGFADGFYIRKISTTSRDGGIRTRGLLLPKQAR